MMMNETDHGASIQDLACRYDDQKRWDFTNQALDQNVDATTLAAIEGLFTLEAILQGKPDQAYAWARRAARTATA